MKKLVVFDLDGTLAESKSAIDAEMATLLTSLLSVMPVAVISGGNWQQFEKQLLAQLGHAPGLAQLSLLPTCGAKFYRYDTAWQLLYSEDFTATEKSKIIQALQLSADSMHFKIDKRWGAVIEDRGSQITYSALGQLAPLADKVKWDPDFSKRKGIKAALDPLIPEFSVHLGGSTSVDVTQQGVDKAYGIRKLRDVLHIPIDQMIYVGDAVFPGGNDYPAKQAGALSIQIQNTHETKRVIEAIIACLQ